MHYQAVITGIGPMAEELLKENLMILFDENAPPSLAEISHMHSKVAVEREIRVGDMVTLGVSRFVVTAVGEEANATFHAMGHCTFSFEGRPEAKLPGQVELTGGSAPELKTGDIFEINCAPEREKII